MVGCYPAVDTALEQFGARLDRVRQDLYYCDVNFLNKRTRSLRRNIHAAGYVYASAALEAFVRETLTAILEEVNTSVQCLADLRLSLFALSKSTHLDALQDLRGLKMWRRRALVFEETMSTGSCDIELDRLPLDGRTLRPQHFEAIWTVFGMPPPSMPSPRATLALQDLAESRNLVAHGEQEADGVAGRKSISDTLALVERIEDVAVHLWESATKYLDDAGYRR
jgi:hypothetical protein